MGINTFIKKIRRGDTGFYNFLHVTIKKIRKFGIPYVFILHDFLYYERRLRINIWRTFWRVFYYQPIFRGRCHSCGRNFHIFNSGQGIPVIVGHLKIDIGDNVKIYDRSTLAGLTVGEDPNFIIGDNSSLNRSTSILVGNEVEIGKNCMINCNLITDNAGHNVEIAARSMKLDVDRIGRIKIGDNVWAAFDSIIIGDVEIGDGSIIAARSVVTKSVPPMSVVAGNPAKVIKRLDEGDGTG